MHLGTFDEKLEATLVSHIPILTARVEQDQAAILGDEDEDDNFRTLLFASQRELRDNAMELKEVSKRTERRDSTTSTLKFEFGKWRARRCPHIF